MDGLKNPALVKDPVVDELGEVVEDEIGIGVIVHDARVGEYGGAPVGDQPGATALERASREVGGSFDPGWGFLLSRWSRQTINLRYSTSPHPGRSRPWALAIGP